MTKSGNTSRRKIPFVVPREPMKKSWNYDHNDKSDEKPSWKYVDHYVRMKGFRVSGVTWIRNPHFSFEHLSPYENSDITLEEYRKRAMEMEERARLNRRI